VPHRAAPAGKKNVAKRLRAKEGGGREEENRPEIATSLSGRLRNRNLSWPGLRTIGSQSSIEIRALIAVK
jgi:hypothetical protein